MCQMSSWKREKKFFFERFERLIAEWFLLKKNHSLATLDKILHYAKQTKIVDTKKFDLVIEKTVFMAYSNS